MHLTIHAYDVLGVHTQVTVTDHDYLGQSGTGKAGTAVLQLQMPGEVQAGGYKDQLAWLAEELLNYAYAR